MFTMNGADWSKRYPRIVEEAARIKASAVMDAEVVCLDYKGVASFDTLHSRTADHLAVENPKAPAATRAVDGTF